MLVLFDVVVHRGQINMTADRENTAMNAPPNDPAIAVPGLATTARRTLAEWHRFVETHDRGVLEALLAPGIVFRSPYVPTPMPGPQASLLVMTTVLRVFENFRYHRTFVAGPHDAALEFSANVGKLELKGVDLIKFDGDGRMIEFEVMIRPFKALQALGEQMTALIGPQLARLKEAAKSP